jgi:hypothetical protein
MAMRTAPRIRAERPTLSGDDGGFVMVWLALLIFVLRVLRVGIDVANWWYVGQRTTRRTQRPRRLDYMPNDARPRSTALKVSSQERERVTRRSWNQEPQPSATR